jgi:hypothetical protein
MKDIMQRLAELEATAPKVTKKRMLREDSTTPPMKVANKPASLKDVFENMAMQKPIPVVGKQGDTQSTGAGFLNINDTSPAGQAMQKALTDLAAQGKAQIVVPTQPGQQQATTAAGKPNPNQMQAGQQAVQEEEVDEVLDTYQDWSKYKNKAKSSAQTAKRGIETNAMAGFGNIKGEKTLAKRQAGIGMANRKYAKDPSFGKEEQLDEKFASQQQAKLMYAAADDKDVSKKTGVSQKVAKEFVKKSHGQKVSKLPKKVKEGDIPSTAGVDTKGAGLGAGRSRTTLEGKKPDFLDLDKDGNKKEPMKKAAADKKKQKVKESMNHRISAARLEGKSHGLRGHAHSGKRYEDLDEIRAYHEGYKEGLDECYGQGVYETAMPATVPGMASAAMPTMEDEMDEGNAFTAALAKTPKGGKFSVGGKTFTDRSNYGENVSEYAFESWDNQLNDLLKEGLSVSISKGQENSPDSVTITAQDAEAEHLLAFVKNAGLGLFGDDNADTHSSAMSVQPSHGAPDEIGAGGVDIGVVDGHDGMMGLMQKLSGIQSDGAADYADEEGDEEQLYGNHEEAGKKDCGCDGDCECSDYDQPANEQSCNECGGMMEAGHSCGSKEVVDEVESEDQMEFEVSEANAPDSGAANATNDMQGNAAANASLAKADAGQDIEDGMSDQAVQESDDEEEETVAESFANLFRKLSFIAEESTEKEDDKAEKAGKKVAKDIEHDEDHKGKDDDKAEKAGKKVTKDIEYDDKKDKKEKVDEWANNAGPGKTVSDTTFEQDIDFMTKVIAGGLNKPKSTGQTTIPVIAGQDDRMIDSPKDWATLAGIKK